MINDEFVKEKIKNGDIKHEFYNNYIMCCDRDKYNENILKITNNKKIIENENIKYLLIEYNITKIDIYY